MKFVTILVLTLGAYVVSADDHGWSYEGSTGPEHWGDLKLGGQNQCGLRKQSPIDIDIQSVRFDANLAPLRLRNYEQIIRNGTIVNNGHAIQLNSPSYTQSISGGPLPGTYNLLQMHFHWGKDNYRGSEHTVNGKRYPIELHLVHSHAAEPGRPSNGKLAVIGVFFDLTRGESNEGIKKITQLISGMKTHGSVDFPTGFSPSLLVPNTRDFFTYEGSLTTPPCSEIVQWLVLREPLKINENDLEVFRSVLFENGQPMVDNFRPVLPVNNRQVTASFMSSSSLPLLSSLPLMIISALLCSH